MSNYIEIQKGKYQTWQNVLKAVQENGLRRKHE